jgi:glycosyltransferase involved in cell wall biosynthesis
MGTPIQSLAEASDNVAVASPHIAVLLATKNGANHLEEQLRSYVAQTFENWSLHVSDDGSSDDTIDVIKRFASASGRVRTLCEGPHLGHAQNFLSLAQNSSIVADYFAFSDQDDIWYPDKLQRALRSLAGISSTTPALYCSRTEIIDEHKKPLGLSPLFHKRPSFQNALVQNIGGGNTMVFNRTARSMLAAAPPDIELIAHDWWTYQMVTGVGGITRYDPWPSVKYRQHEHNLVGSNVGMRQRTLRLRAFAKGRVVTWNDTNIEALNKMRHLLTPSSVATLDQFAQARKTQLPKRLYLLWKAGAYRQSVLDNIGIVLGSLLGRI